ncbi:response regulator [Pendulispora albinea]|uniref:Response regulator n=1 Tax=Pendulispora albinea TaxID=2741071 RepID=A0ABZ2M0T8_9BACT
MQADFVGSLGRKTGEARTALAALEADPKARGPRDDVRRRLHAIGTAARLLHFDSTRVAIGLAEEVLERIAESGTASQQDLEQIGRVLDDLPILAWEDVSEKRSASEAAATSAPQAAAPHTALVVGEDAIAMAISEGPADAGRAAGEGFECERTTDATYAAVLAQEMSPDVVVIDGDLEGTDELVETLLDRMELAPIVVLGRFEEATEEARFIALGVAKTLKKPASEESLYTACREAADQHRERTVRITLPAVDASGAVSSAGDAAKREAGDTEVPGADRAFSRGRGAAADVRLEGRRVVVADDDPGVAWFIADLLRTTGCIVHEAHDGEEALELAYKTAPHLLLSDVLMPKLDGFQLARALKRDVALRDTPVILLSWKEDMLQRVRELGAGAAGYLRKESDARAILARVREALWPRARIEARLRGRQEVRGRLDGLTVRSLLELVCTTRPKSRVCLRDASYVYELEIRDGAPCRATRTAPDGTMLRGGRALAAMLGVWAGRFHVAPSEDPLECELLGTFRAQTAEPIAHARGAAHLLSGARVLGVAKVVVDSEIIAGYLGATPPPVRRLVERVAEGESPRQVLLRGNVDPVMLEGALLDLAARGAVAEVYGAQGQDLLRPAIDAALRMESGTAQTAEERTRMRLASIPSDDGEAQVGVEDELAEVAVSEAARAGSGSAQAARAGSGSAQAAKGAAQPVRSGAQATRDAGAEEDAPRSYPDVTAIESELTSNTPMASVVARSAPAPRRRERRWFGAAIFGAVLIAALGARAAVDAPGKGVAASGGSQGGTTAGTRPTHAGTTSAAAFAEPRADANPQSAPVPVPAASAASEPATEAPRARHGSHAADAGSAPKNEKAKDAGSKSAAPVTVSATGLDVAAAAAAELHAPNASTFAP